MSRKTADLTALQQAFPYPRSGTGATTDLGRVISTQITESGPIPFSDFMGLALYHPELGYYARPDARTVSKNGDFMTSVSVGPVFGILLARRLHRFWQANGSPSKFTLLEPGAHDGSLAIDILNEIDSLDSDFAKATRYIISEPLPARRLILEKNLGNLATIIASPDEAQADFGALIANEILDALPVPLHFLSKNEWHEALVTNSGDRLEWASRPIQLALPTNFPEGYVTEGPPDLNSFFKPLSDVFKKALFIWIDYGLDEETLYHPARTAGTLRGYRQHRTKVHPLDHPGEQDLTADVNFTAVENSARALGFTIQPAMNQSRYLTYCGRDWLLAGPSAKEISQFQTLIHPSQFGNRFYALEMTKGGVVPAFP